MLCRLTDIHKSYPDAAGAQTLRVLRGVSLELDTGESAAILGPSGSGKTTLLSIAATLERPERGRVCIDGCDVSGMSDNDLARARNSRIGIVFQHHLLLEQLSLLENVLLPTIAWPDTRTPQQRLQRALDIIDRVGLSARLEHRPAQLSGGERQRAAVVRALINAPALVCADEPTGSLDHESALALGTLLCELNREQRTALLLVTHSAELAACMDRRFALRGGTLEPLT